MPAKSKAKRSSKKWWEKLDADEIREARQEAIVDAYDEYEQHSGLVAVIQDELQFPFRAKVLGEELEIVDVAWPEGGFDLDLICVRDGNKYPIEARNVELLEPLPPGHLYLAAYLDWKRRM